MKVLIACEYSGRVREAFRAKGHDVISCDFEPSEDHSSDHYQGDVFDLISRRKFDLMIAHPPCTYLCNSGVRWLYRKTVDAVTGRVLLEEDDDTRWAKMREGAAFFARLMNAPIPQIAAENPIMHGHAVFEIESRIGRMNTHFVQPWWYGDRAFKATGFTLKGLRPLVKPPTALVPPKPKTAEHKAWSVIHQASPGPNRWKERSRTFLGIANAMAEAWG